MGSAMGSGVTAGIFDQAWLQAVLGSLGLIVVLAMVLERALSIVFEWGLWDVWLAKKNLRAPLAFVVSFIVCGALQFDILHVIGDPKNTAPFHLFAIGTFLTAATIAGGSKGAITLFQQVLGFSKGGNPDTVKEISRAKADQQAATT